MKKILTTLFTVLTIHYVQAQDINPQTNLLGYLKSIEANKNFYIGKTFGVLLDSLKVKPQSFFPKVLSQDFSKEASTNFYFMIPESVEDFDSPKVTIFWTNFLNGTVSDQIFSAAPDHEMWNAPARQFYSGAIIKDIMVWGKNKKSFIPSIDPNNPDSLLNNQP